VQSICRPRAPKKIIRAFYGERAKHSYFSSCSNGGRQALMEIQRFPEDYDGVLVGAPAHDWSHLMAGFVWNEQAQWNTAGGYLAASKLAAVQAATLRELRCARRGHRRGGRGPRKMPVQSGKPGLSHEHGRPKLSHAAGR